MSKKRYLVDLASRAKTYDPQAFAELFDLYFEKMHRFMYFNLGNLDKADELAAEVFAKAMESIDNFDDRGGSIGAWIYGIGRNILNEYYRSTSRVYIVPLDPNRPSPASEAPDKVVLSELTYSELWQAVAQLPFEQREIVVLRFVEDYKVKEVAELTGKSPGAVRALQHRAINRLRRAFNGAIIQDERRSRVQQQESMLSHGLVGR